MKLTKLSAAPTLAPQAALGRRCRLMPAPSRSDAGTASQLIPGVRRTWFDRRAARLMRRLLLLTAMALASIPFPSSAEEEPVIWAMSDTGNALAAGWWRIDVYADGRIQS